MNPKEYAEALAMKAAHGVHKSTPEGVIYSDDWLKMQDAILSTIPLVELLEVAEALKFMAGHFHNSTTGTYYCTALDGLAIDGMFKALTNLSAKLNEKGQP